MRSSLTACVVFSFFAGVCAALASANGQDDGKDPRKDAIAKDRKALQGAWRVVELKADGQKIPLKKDQSIRFIFTDDKLSIEEGGKLSDEATYAIDPSVTPKHIDTTGTKGARKDVTYAGIYEIKGDELRYCDAKGSRRPTGFDTSKATMIWYSFVLQREKR